MDQQTKHTQHFVFLYTGSVSQHFWVYDRNHYHRFLWNDGGLWYIRAQSYLPAYVVGQHIVMNHAQHAFLNHEARRYGVVIPWFASEQECNFYALQLNHRQFIFDCEVPGGYFSLENGLRGR